jgi:hypothetical protein
MNEPIRITREELYGKVWTTPATTLAKEFDISDVALAKICQKLNVPKPGRGYWRALEVGEKVKRAPLPPLDADARAETTINPEPHRRKKMAEGVSTQKRKFEVIPVPETLHGAHPVILQAKRSLEAGEVQNGIVWVPWDKKVLNIEVSRGAAHRALRLLDAVIKAVEKRGAKFVRSEKRNSEFMLLMIGDDCVGLQMTEIVETTKREPKSEADRQLPWRLIEHRPTGRLEFRILASEPKGARRSWTDCTQHKLDEKVGEIVEWIFVTAEGVKRARLAWEENQREWAEIHRRSEEEARRRRIEEEKRAKLLEQCQSWVLARNLRVFVAACEKALGGGKTTVGEGQHGWIAWAYAHADRIDPIKNGYLDAEVGRSRADAHPHDDLFG